MANIYVQKKNWKKILVAFGVVIVLLSFWYTNLIVSNIADEERVKVKLWAEAIQKKAKLVKFTDQLFDKLREEERKKVELWVDASTMLTSPNPNIDYGFLTKILTSNTTVPVIWTDENGRIKSYRNLDSEIFSSEANMQLEVINMGKVYKPIEIVYADGETDFLYYKDSKLIEELEQTFDDLEQSFISEVVTNSASVPVIYTDSSMSKILSYGNIDSNLLKDKSKLNELIADMKKENVPIEIELQEGSSNYILYRNSWILTQLKYYPFIQFGIIGFFIIISYFLFSTARRSEQNQVWVGMAKETAHQLGTPLSSLMGWVEYIRMKKLDDTMANELEKDVKRLETITDRFSKIGSLPELKPQPLITALQHAIGYMETRSPKKVEYAFIKNSRADVALNEALFNWVIENLCRNAIDAMGGKGKITFHLDESESKVVLDITDTGKGMKAADKKNVFEPGYTTKKRGWGLGLTLAKRIVEEYHNGKIFVKHSKIDEGSTIRITLDKA